VGVYVGRLRRSDGDGTLMGVAQPMDGEFAIAVDQALAENPPPD